MQLICPQCRQSLTFDGAPPKFCSHCGQNLSTPTTPQGESSSPGDTAAFTPTYDPEAATVAPSAATVSALPPITDTLGGYKLLRTLGGGGMGTVYEAEDPLSGRHVALKVVLPEFAGSKETVERFRQEGELASSLVHPRCVFVLGANEDAGRPYIVMELMSGQTLQDLVAAGGPLRAEDAIRKIMDVMDGLEEAHRLGLVHRDVKPSNCFLEPDGHVKIGDFGLARSLVKDTHLTRTGTFLGTPLYSSPEQVKAEKVDAQSDIYSVAATLYFLLTGKAPFQSGDAMATLARIVSDDAPSMRLLKPELPKALDRAVLRGLERDRKRRYKDIGEFRRALVRFLPVGPAIGDTGVRFGAWMIDYAVMQIGLNAVIVAGIELANLIFDLTGNQQSLAGATLGALSHILYFGLMEGLLGWSLGKGALRLRVCRLNDTRPPGILRATIRMLVLTVSLTAGFYVVFLPEWLGLPRVPGSTFLASLLPLVLPIVGLFLLLGPMRRSNGYRGLHEWLSGTRTVRLAWPQSARRPSFRSRVKEVSEGEPADDLPERVGPYQVRGLVNRREDSEVLLAEEPSLKRRVWLWLRPLDAPLIPEVQRRLDRTTRQRWLACGKHEDRQWDAFLPPRGEPLSELIRREGRQSWSEARILLDNVSEELALAVEEGSLPPNLDLGQVRLRADGQLILVDLPVAASAGRQETLTNQERCLELTRQVASLTLEGRPREAHDRARPIETRLADHARRILGLLFGQPQRRPRFRVFTGDRFELFRKQKQELENPYDRVEQLLAALAATERRPSEMTRWLRAMLVLLQGFFLLLGLAVMAPLTMVVMHGLIGTGFGELTWLVYLGVGSFVLVYLCTELSFRIMAVTMVRHDGRRASMWRRIPRALLLWGFLAMLFWLLNFPLVIFEELPVQNWVRFMMLGVVLTSLLSYLAVIIWYPTRAPHDRIVGTYLVPE